MARVKLVLILSLLLNIAGVVLYYGAESTVNITSRLVNYFGVAPTLLCAKDNNLLYHSINKPQFRIHGRLGLRTENKDLSRIQLDGIDIRDSLKKQAKNTTGIRVRFKTNSVSMALRFTGLILPGLTSPHHSAQGASGIDVYVNGQYLKTLLASDCGSSIRLKNDDGGQVSNIELYLASFSNTKLLDIGLDKTAEVLLPDSYEKSIVYYGTSITQGSGASRSSLSYPSIVSRRLNADFYNLGFSGNARGDIEIAEAISKQDADVVVLEFSRQARPHNGKIGNRLRLFYDVIRANKPVLPIVIISSFYDLSERIGNDDIEKRRKQFLEAYLEMKKNEENVHFLHGTELLGEADEDGLVDGTHLNTLGASIVADRLSPALETILNSNKSVFN